MPGNYSIQVRNIDEYTFNKLNEMAEKAGLTAQKLDFKAVFIF